MIRDYFTYTLQDYLGGCLIQGKVSTVVGPLVVPLRLVIVVI